MRIGNVRPCPGSHIPVSGVPVLVLESNKIRSTSADRRDAKGGQSLTGVLHPLAAEVDSALSDCPVPVAVKGLVQVLDPKQGGVLDPYERHDAFVHPIRERSDGNA